MRLAEAGLVIPLSENFFNQEFTVLDEIMPSFQEKTKKQDKQSILSLA